MIQEKDSIQELRKMYGGTTVHLSRGDSITVEEFPLVEYERLFEAIPPFLEKIQGTKFDQTMELKDLPQVFLLATKEMITILEIVICQPGIFKEKKIGLKDGLSILEAIVKENQLDFVEKKIQELVEKVKIFIGQFSTFSGISKVEGTK